MYGRRIWERWHPDWEPHFRRGGMMDMPARGGQWMARGGWGEYDRDFGGSRRPRHGNDYWWLGEREMERHGPRTSYDSGYVDFNERTHPRYSPIGGMYPTMGGSYAHRRPPRPLRESMHFSDWTRWF